MTQADWIIMGVIHTVNMIVLGNSFKKWEGDGERAFDAFIYIVITLAVYAGLMYALTEG